MRIAIAFFCAELAESEVVEAARTVLARRRKVAHVVVRVARQDGVIESQSGHVAVHLLAQLVEGLAGQGDEHNVTSAYVKPNGREARRVLNPR
jgi:hypothetical protein